jgi:hypothetical protein
MKYSELTGVSIQSSFEEFHRLNPQVWEKFVELAMSAVRRGKTKISFKLIMNVIRWEHFMQTEEPVSLFHPQLPAKFKINDAYGSRYARLFATSFPEHADKIEFRKLRSE